MYDRINLNGASKDWKGKCPNLSQNFWGNHAKVCPISSVSLPPHLCPLPFIAKRAGTLCEFGFDSLKAVELHSRLEALLNCTIPKDSIFGPNATIPSIASQLFIILEKKDSNATRDSNDAKSGGLASFERGDSNRGGLADFAQFNLRCPPNNENNSNPVTSPANSLGFTTVLNHPVSGGNANTPRSVGGIVVAVVES